MQVPFTWVLDAMENEICRPLRNLWSAIGDDLAIADRHRRPDLG